MQRAISSRSEGFSSLSLSLFSPFGAGRASMVKDMLFAKGISLARVDVWASESPLTRSLDQVKTVGGCVAEEQSKMLTGHSC